MVHSFSYMYTCPNPCTTDVLDQFDSTPNPKPTATTSKPPIPRPPQPQSKSPTPGPPNPPPPSSTLPNTSIPSFLANDPGKDDGLDSDFARELQKGMEEFMREIREMGLGVGGVDNSASGSSAVPNVSEGKQDFKAGIKAAMEKLKSSESGFKVRTLLNLLQLINLC